MTPTQKTSIDLLHKTLTDGFKKGKYQEPIVLKIDDDTFGDCEIKPGDCLSWDPGKQAIFHHITLKN